MKYFYANIYKPDSIVLKNSKELTELYDLIDKDENFIIMWKEGGKNLSEVVITTHLSSKVKNGNMVLRSEE